MAENINENKIIQLQNEVDRLKTAVEELSILNEIATAISSTTTLDKVINLIVQKCVKHLKVEQGAVQLLDEKDEVNPFHTMIRTQDSQLNFLPYRLDTQLTGWMIKNLKPLLINDLKSDSRFQFTLDKDTVFNSMLCVPMLLKGKLLGCISVFNKRNRGEFTLEDQRLLSIIASQSAHIIENARLYEEEQALIRMKEEMRLAKEIQLNLLPKSVPQISGYQITGTSIPAKEVGGDYFDFIMLEKNKVAFALGDISGKGIPAAMLMANLQATLRAQVNADSSCNECIARANNLLYKSTDSMKFATLFYGMLDYEENKLIYCNAGHDNPFYISNAKIVKRLNKGGMILGFLPDAEYEIDQVEFCPGDLLVIYSDGITESMNAMQEEWGENKLMNLIIENLEQPANTILQSIFDSAKIHAGIMEQSDDMTLVIIKRDK